MKMRICAPLNQDVVPGLLEVEITSRFQIPSFTVVGLADREVAEARERVRAAIEASGWEFPQRKIVINLSPADVRKSGTGLDLPMALAVLAESSPHSGPSLSLCAWGELGLDGRVKSAGHVLRTIHSAWSARCHAVLLPHEDASTAHQALALLRNAGFEQRIGSPPRLHPLKRLSEWREALTPRIIHTPLEQPTIREAFPEKDEGNTHLALPAVLGKAVGLAVAGFHHLYLAGPRGSGKSTAVDTLTHILPDLSAEQRVTRALLQELAPRSASSSRVVRVGQSVRPQALVGSLRAAELRPGQFSLAHGGVLLADELPEWDRDAIESLREPLERGAVSLTRVDRSVELPARFLLAGTGNLCPCGGEPESWIQQDDAVTESSDSTRCRCLATARQRYLLRVSGPILDRFDLVVPARSGGMKGELMDIPSMRLRADQARERLFRAWGVQPGLLPRNQLEEILRDSPKIASDPALARAPSLRTRHKLFRVALTLAAWHGKERPEPAHLREARFFRVQNLERL